jgi:hypothetical protein
MEIWIPCGAFGNVDCVGNVSVAAECGIWGGDYASADRGRDHVIDHVI